MIEGMDKFIGRKLKAEYIEQYRVFINEDEWKIVTRPDDLGPRTHMNMEIYFDGDCRITRFDGSRWNSCPTSLYSRSAKVWGEGSRFNSKEMAYLRRFVKEITEEV